MPAQLIDGKELAEKITNDLKVKIAKLDTKPGLAAILVGANPASQLYIKLKAKACREVGVDFSSYLLGENCKEEEIIEVIKFLNKDEDINGILLQLPLPKKFNTDKIIEAISPQKDVDGFLPKSKIISPTALSAIELIKNTGVDLKNKKIVVLSNSEKFAEPFQAQFKNNEVKWLSPKVSSSKFQAPSFKLQVSSADILIVAVGQPKFIKPKMIKKDAIIIDVGINKVKGKTVGDVDPAVDKIASYRSPVPGGVGPITIAMLLANLYKLTKK